MIKKLVIGLMLLTMPAMAQGIPKVPYHVNDMANLLSPSEFRALDSKLTKYQKDSTNQIVLLTLSTIPDDAPIEDFAVTVFKAWQLGQKGVDNGILVVIVPAAPGKPGKAKIEVGYGLESSIPDSKAGSILREALPDFGKKHYADALTKISDGLISAAGLPEEKKGAATLAPAKPDITAFKVAGWMFFFAFAGVLGYMAYLMLAASRQRELAEEAAKRRRAEQLRSAMGGQGGRASKFKTEPWSGNGGSSSPKRERRPIAPAPISSPSKRRDDDDGAFTTGAILGGISSSPSYNPPARSEPSYAPEPSYGGGGESGGGGATESWSSSDSSSSDSSSSGDGGGGGGD